MSRVHATIGIAQLNGSKKHDEEFSDPPPGYVKGLDYMPEPPEEPIDFESRYG